MAERLDAVRNAISLPTLLRRKIRGFRRDQRGATAVEFALIALPFFGLLFTIIETALVFLLGQALETATANSARLIRTGQATAFKIEDFRGSICGQLEVLFGCAENLRLDVRTAANFAAGDMSTPVSNGVLNTDGFGFDSGGGDEIVVVRVFFEWPTVARFFGTPSTTLANGNYLLTATAAFRNEPF